MILGNFRQNALEIGSMQGKENELKSLWTTDLWPMIHIWESSRGNYLRRTLLMTSTSLKLSESQKTQQDKKALIVHIPIYQPQAKPNIDMLYLKDLSL